MSQGGNTIDNANPVCTSDGAQVPPDPIEGELVDPAEPHPAEPGAPADAPTQQMLAVVAPTD